MPAGSSASCSGGRALALLLLSLAGCGRHDTPLASYHAQVPTVGGAGAGGNVGAGGGDDSAGAAPALECAPSYTLVVDGLTSRYREVMTGRHWVEAEQDCESDGGHLVIIDSEPENAFMAAFAAKAITDDKSTHQLAWFGLGDSANEGDFRWVTGSTLGDAFWSDGEPNTAFKDEDCVEMRASGQWNDDRCDAPLIYVCECDGALSTGEWCDSNTDASCGDCVSACPAEQSCVKQQCQ